MSLNEKESFYFTLEQATDFLADKTGKRMELSQTLLKAKEGKFRLCMRFNGTLHHFIHDIETGKHQRIDDYKFDGFIQIPLKAIPDKIPADKPIQFNPASIVEVIYLPVKNRDPRTVPDGCLTGKCKNPGFLEACPIRYRKSINENISEYIPGYISCGFDNLWIPEDDLIKYADAIISSRVQNNLLSNDQRRDLFELANQVAEEIRASDRRVSLNDVAKELTKSSKRNTNKHLLGGQKGWHEVSWIKDKLKGWEDPNFRK